MAESKTSGTSMGRLSTINTDAAGIDIGSTFHVVAMASDRDDRPVRTFRTFSNDLHQVAEWLTETGIKTVAMESTGVYWIPVFDVRRQTDVRRCRSAPRPGRHLNLG